jgi:hypothetical protein
MKSPAVKTCDHCPMGQKDEWRKKGALLRMDLLRHDLDLREFKIANLILDKTYGWQRESVVFPQLRFFRDFTGIAESDVVKVLQSLHARRVIRIVTVKGQPNYSLNPDSEAWKALPRASTETMQTANNVMREINGLEPLAIEQEAELNFKVGHAAKKLSTGIGSKPMCKPICQQTGEFPNLL